jgi:hypothetical protein
MDTKERNFVESSKMREFWEDSSFQHLKTSWNNGFQQFSFFRFLDIEYTNLWEEWDEAEGMGSSDEDLVEDFTVGNYPIIDQMYNDWGYNIEYAIVEYMDIVRGIKEGIEDGRLSETRTTIKRILKESKFDSLVKIAINRLIEKFTTNQDGSKVEYRTLLMWKSEYVDTYLTDMFGITEKDTKEIYDAIISEWLSEATGLPKTGSRVRIIKMDDPFTRLTPGDEGIITSYNNSPWGPQLSVQWDMGSTLDLVPGEDEWEVLSN